MSGLLPGTLPQHPRRRDILERLAPTSGYLFRTLQRPQASGRGMHNVERIVTAERLGEHVVHTRALEDRTHRSTRDHTRTRARGTQQHHARSGLTLHTVRDTARNARHTEEVLLRFLDALRDRGGHLLGLAVANADLSVTVTDDDQGREAETPTALNNLGHAVDCYDTLEMRGLLLGRPATATVLAVPAVLAAAAFTLAGRPALLTAGLPCTSRHQAF